MEGLNAVQNMALLACDGQGYELVTSGFHSGSECMLSIWRT